MDALVIDDARQINEAIAATSFGFGKQPPDGQGSRDLANSEREGRQSIALKGGLTPNGAYAALCHELSPTKFS